MNILRSFARPMLAAPFLVDGLDALVRPSRHVEKFEKVAPTLERVGLPPVLTSDARLLTRASGAVSLVAGLGLAAGRAPRTNATILAALNVPLTVVNNPVCAWWSVVRARARTATGRTWTGTRVAVACDAQVTGAGALWVQVAMGRRRTRSQQVPMGPTRATQAVTERC